MGISIGVNDIAKSVSKLYIGNNNVAKTISKVYIGVDNTAKLVYEGGRQSESATLEAL